MSYLHRGSGQRPPPCGSYRTTGSGNRGGTVFNGVRFVQNDTAPMDGQQAGGRRRHGRVSVLGGGGGGFVQTLHFCRYSAKCSQDNVVG